MECLEKHDWIEYTREELEKIKIQTPDETIRKKVQKNWDSVAKPLDSMGRFEELTAQIGGILGTEDFDLSKKAVLIFCADNGIVEEGVSQSGQEVTLAVAKSMGKQKSSVGKMAAKIGADTIPVDIGINCAGTFEGILNPNPRPQETTQETIPGVLNCKIRSGTANFLKKPAMTEEETVKAIAVGMNLVHSCKEKGYTLLATGEMGIGNTTTSSAICAALLDVDVEAVTGRGAGLDDKGLLRKHQVITEAILKYDLKHADAFTVLQTVGGLDIAGLVGVCIGGAVYGVPIVLDGVISAVAALVAEKLFPGTKQFLLPPHKGKEPAIQWICEKLQLTPIVDASLALGEGTGAVMLFALLDMAMCLYEEKTLFSDISVEQYERFK